MPRPKKSESTRKQSIKRTFKRLALRVKKLNKNHYVAVVAFVDGKFEINGSPVMCQVLSTPEVINAIQESINNEIAKKYLKPSGKKKPEKVVSDTFECAEEVVIAAEDAEIIMKDAEEVVIAAEDAEIILKDMT